MEDEFASYDIDENTGSYDGSDDDSLDSSSSNDSDEDSYDLGVPPILENYEFPTPYNFRIKPTAKKRPARKVRCPPFHLQLDHAIAVIWYIFDPDKQENWTLGIGQLQWALYFLRAIKHPADGTRSPDIELAIKAVEDTLLDFYADMANVVLQSSPHQGTACTICDMEKNGSKSNSQICFGAACGLFGHPTNMDFNSFRHGSTNPRKSVGNDEQTEEQLRNEIEQLKRLAVSLSVKKRKIVRVVSFTDLDSSN